jgi:hypothetical protein
MEDWHESFAAAAAAAAAVLDSAIAANHTCSLHAREWCAGTCEIIVQLKNTKWLAEVERALRYQAGLLASLQSQQRSAWWVLCSTRFLL